MNRSQRMHLAPNPGTNPGTIESARLDCHGEIPPMPQRQRRGMDGAPDSASAIEGRIKSAGTSTDAPSFALLRRVGLASNRVPFALGLAAVLLVSGCRKSDDTPSAGAPPKATVETEQSANLFKPDHPSQFPLAAATAYSSTSSLSVTGSVNPDVSRTVPVISLASGRVVSIRAALGDEVKKGQLLMQVQSNDVATGFDQYLKAVNDERLANVQYQRAKLLYDKGAVARSQLEMAENSEQDAKTDLTAAEQQLKVLGVDKDHPSPIVNVYAPISGVIVAQNVTNAAAAGVAYAGTSTVFTIADLSQVWIICDVYENDLPQVRVGETADIRLNAYPDRPLTGRISDEEPILDPVLRTAKVRIVVANPGFMRVGMFATATIHGHTIQTHAAVPASAVLHLHDRDWVYVPAPNGAFQRLAVVAGAMLPGNLQEITSGIAVGQQVVTNALELQSTVEQ